MTTKLLSSAPGTRRPGSGVRTICLLTMLAIVSTFGAGVAALAQGATPIAAGSSPATGAGCGERLGIGDGSVACLTFVHASSDAGSVDITVDGNVLFSGVGFGTSTGFVAVPADSYDLAVTAAGQPGTVLLDDSGVDLVSGQGVEVAIVGSRDSATLTSLTVPVGQAAPSPGSASLRVVQAIPDAPPLDIGLPGGAPLIANLAPLSASDELTIPAGATSVEVRTAGTADVLFPVPTFPVEDGGSLTVYALGTVTNPTGIILLTVLVPGVDQSPAATPVAGTPAA